GYVAVVSDMVSDMDSRPVEVKRYGVIFAGAQKNLGPAGLTVVIIRKDLAERADKNLPTLLQYRTHIKENSLYHTPPAFAVYVVGLVVEWIESEGGVQGMEKRNEAKARLLYDTIEASGGFYSCPVEKASRCSTRLLGPVPGGGPLVYSDIESAAAVPRPPRFFLMDSPLSATTTRKPEGSTVPRQTLTITDNRTGKSYEIPITHDTIRA